MKCSLTGLDTGSVFNRAGRMAVREIVASVLAFAFDSRQRAVKFLMHRDRDTSTSGVFFATLHDDVDNLWFHMSFHAAESIQRITR
jgi:hypothetical protein